MSFNPLPLRKGNSTSDSTSVSSFKQHSVSPLSSMALCPNEGQRQALQLNIYFKTHTKSVYSKKTSYFMFISCRDEAVLDLCLYIYMCVCVPDSAGRCFSDLSQWVQSFTGNHSEDSRQVGDHCCNVWLWKHVLLWNTWWTDVMSALIR